VAAVGLLQTVAAPMQALTPPAHKKNMHLGRRSQLVDFMDFSVTGPRRAAWKSCTPGATQRRFGDDLARARSTQLLDGKRYLSNRLDLARAMHGLSQTNGINQRCRT
jgi:hypothetical protein